MDNAAVQSRDALWVPVVAPVIWVVHFMICYPVAALLCGRFSDPMATGLRTLAVGATIPALAGIGWMFLHGLRRHRYAWPERPHDDDTPEDRSHFLAFTTLLLAGLSAVATVFVALAIWLVPSC
jgi:hypothetical protein